MAAISAYNSAGPRKLDNPLGGASGEGMNQTTPANSLRTPQSRPRGYLILNLARFLPRWAIPRLKRGPRPARETSGKAPGAGFAQGLLVGILCLSLAWFGLFLLQLGEPLSSAAWMKSAYAIKHARAAEVGRPKVLLVGGSSTLFSLDSRQLQQAWERPVVNFGANAALGLRYILASARPYLQPGDLVLMPLEYNLYQDSGTPNDQLLDYIVGQDPDYWRALDPVSRYEIVARLPASRLLMGIRALKHPNGPYTGLYAPEYIDTDGNYRANDPALFDVETQGVIRNALDAAIGKVHQYGQDDHGKSYGWRLLERYQRELRAAGVCVLLIPPSMMFQDAYRDDPLESAFYRNLPRRADELGLTYLGEPLGFMYPSERFFDSLYHLDSEARVEHTQKVIDLLGPDPWRHCAERG